MPAKIFRRPVHDSGPCRRPDAASSARQMLDYFNPVSQHSESL